jgi:hypothetical protein
MTRALLVLAFGVLVGSVPAAGHHSFAAFYLEDQLVSISGEVAVFEYVNPHAWLYVDAVDKAGETRRVGAEWGNPNGLRQQGIGVDTLRPGDWVIITGSPSRDPNAYKLHLKGIERPADGWKWVPRSRRGR